jgi:hypothetical protein
MLSGSVRLVFVTQSGSMTQSQRRLKASEGSRPGHQRCFGLMN